MAFLVKFLGSLLVVCFSVLATGSAPAALNLVLIGFHRPELGWVSDYDLERTMLGTIVSKTLSLGEGPFNRLTKVVSQQLGDVSDAVMAMELESLNRALGLDREGFTLFVLNLGKSDGNPYAYCESSMSHELEEDSLLLFNSALGFDDRGELWAKARGALEVTQGACKAEDTCRVNAWITDNRVSWIDLTAQRIPWGNKYGLSIPPPPTHEMTLVEQQQRALQITNVAMTAKNCKECKPFLQTWASLLDRVSQETDFGRAYDIVARAGDALESVVSRDFAVTTSRNATTYDSYFSLPTSTTNVDFLAHLSLVVKSFANRILLPFNSEAIHTSSLYGFPDDQFESIGDPTTRVTVHLFLVRGHDDAKDSGPTEEDVALMRDQLERLSSPPFQTFSMIVHRLDLDHDHVLSAAFWFSSHTMVVPTLVDGRQVGQTTHYVNAKEFRQILLSVNDRSHSEFSSIGRRSDHHTELPIFWFYGVDSSKEPLYVDGFHRALDVKDLVIVIESKHASVERLNAWCGASRVKVSVERPLRAAIIATAHLWWRENLGEDAAERYIDEAIQDWSWSVGVGDARGLSLFEEREERLGRELLSTVLVDAFHRSSVLEAMRRVKKMVDNVKKAYKHNTSTLNDILSLRLEILDCSRKNDWKCAFEKLVVCLEKAKLLSNPGTVIDSRSKCKGNRIKTNSWFSWWQRFRRHDSSATHSLLDPVAEYLQGFFT